MTVTGTWLPSSPKTWVMPTLRPMSPSLRAISGPSQATASDEPHEARGRSGPERTGLYVKSREGVRSRRASARGEPEGGRVRRGAESIGVAAELDFDVDAAC